MIWIWILLGYIITINVLFAGYIFIEEINFPILSKVYKKKWKHFNYIKMLVIYVLAYLTFLFFVTFSPIIISVEYIINKLKRK